MSIWLTKRYFCKDSSAIDDVNFLKKKYHIFNNIYRVDEFGGRQIAIEQNYDLLKITIPSVGMFSIITFYNLLKIVCFVLTIFIINYIKTKIILQSSFAQTIFLPVQIFLDITITFFGFCLLILLFKLLLDIFGKMKVTIDDKHLTIIYSLFGIENHKTQIISLKDIIQLEKHKNHNKINSYIEIIIHQENYIISSNPHFLITYSEIDLIGNTISNWLNISLIEITDLTSEELKKAICDVQQLSDTN